MPPSIALAGRLLYRRLRDFTARRCGRHDASAIRGLDRRTLADIGLNAREIDSIEAESQGRAQLTRLRVVVGL